MQTKESFSITLVYAPLARTVQEMALTVVFGCTVEQALQCSGLLSAVSREQLQTLHLSVWGRRATGSQILRANDRIEICRPLKVDPKVARRERFASQGAKTAGLFAKRRAGAKAGY
jgi:putative ubiquitin-RnfH superfamily antitoxin RatB of RatAB toxin-antitoxin module